mmetsp:Transcript_30968/g.65928  ORF Transcript_30968/g.65928 Transcript_30968/m.65928 type:complete len:211 (-) Transcript_30968:68-700(-)
MTSPIVSLQRRPKHNVFFLTNCQNAVVFVDCRFHPTMTLTSPPRVIRQQRSPMILCWPKFPKHQNESFLVQPQIPPYHPPQRAKKSGQSLRRLPRRPQRRPPAGVARHAASAPRDGIRRRGVRRPRGLLVQFVDLGVHVLQPLLPERLDVLVRADGEFLEGPGFGQALDEYFVGEVIGHPLDELIHVRNLLLLQSVRWFTMGRIAMPWAL